jgi:transcriptional regulator with XRE-family HTH domain
MEHETHLTLRDLRLSRGMSQADLGRAVGCGQANIARIENGMQSAWGRTISRIADALGVTAAVVYSSLPAKRKPVAP